MTLPRSPNFLQRLAISQPPAVREACAKLHQQLESRYHSPWTQGYQGYDATKVLERHVQLHGSEALQRQRPVAIVLFLERRQH